MTVDCSRDVPPYFSAPVTQTFNYGAKAQVRQGTVPRHAAAGVLERGHGLQRLGGAGDEPLQPALFLSHQAGDVGGAGPGRDEHRHALRLSELPRAVVHLDGARRGRVRAGRGAVQRADQRKPPLVRRRRVWRAAIRAREAERHLLYRGAARAADGSHRRDSARAGADRRRGGRARRADSARAGSRHRDDAAA